METLIDITDNALNFLKNSIADENCLGIRINIVPGGCQGMTYEVSFVKEVNPSDLAIQKDGVNIYIVSEAVVFISGMTMDYVSRPMGGNLVFANPNARSCCSCGKSFNVNKQEACGGGCCF